VPPAPPPPSAAELSSARVAARTVAIFLRLLPLVVSFARDFRRWVFAGRPLARSAAFHTRRAERLVTTIAELGPAMVKLAQVLAARADLVPEPYLHALGALHDQVPPVPAAAVRRTIEATFDRPVEAIFTEFDWTPVAAASLGQVHRATYDGETVAVKVLRPGVEARVRRDLAAAARLLSFAERRFAGRTAARHLAGVRTAVDEFARRVGDEVDLRHEAENAREMRTHFLGRPGVVMPRVIGDLVGREVLVLEFMPGTRVDRLQDRVADGRLDAEELVRRVIELYMRMMLVDGFFHADPHPGNLLVQDDGTLVVLDFGMVVRVERTLRRDLARTAFAGIRRNPDALVEGFYTLGVLAPEADRATARALVAALLDIAHTADTSSTDRMQLVADRVMATLYEFPVTLPSDLVYFARTAALIEGLGARYDRQFNAVTFAAPVALRMHREILASLADDDGRLPDGVPDWLAGLGATVGEVVVEVATVARRVGRGLAGLFGQLAAEVDLVLREASAARPAAPVRALPGAVPGAALDGVPSLGVRGLGAGGAPEVGLAAD
jgi:predicted unusual protein kinase regulating ubiquinone biosynthesis (AarF/ABC1/UbiB family)